MALKLSPAQKILRTKSLKDTALRRALMDAFLAADGSLSQADLIAAAAKRKLACDRVSIYRNLRQFLAAGLVHEIEPNIYAYCHHRCQDHAHVLMYCSVCHHHEEIADRDLHALLKPVLNYGFFDRTSPIALRGVCRNCAASA